RWQWQNRRYLGVSFAISHFVHAAAIAGFAQLDPMAFHQEASPGMFVLGGLAYLFIAALALTSFDRTAAWLGARAWRILHVAGTHYIWLSFVFTFGKRAAGNPAYWLPVAILFGVMALRLF